MKKSLKKIALGFLALTFPCLGWSVEPTYWASFDSGNLASDKVSSSAGFSFNGSFVPFFRGANKAWDVTPSPWGTQSILPTNSTTFTISVNAKLGTNSNGILLAFANKTDGGLVLRRTNDNVVAVTVGASSNVKLFAPIPNCATYYHNYVIVADATTNTLKLYVDGTLVADVENTSTGTYTLGDGDTLIPNNNFQIGSRHSGRFEPEVAGNGAIDELAIWSETALTAENVKTFYDENYKWWTSKSSDWTFDGSLDDLMGKITWHWNKDNPVYVNTVLSSKQYERGIQITDSFHPAPSNGAYQLPNAFTTMAYVNVTNVPEKGTLVSYGASCWLRKITQDGEVSLVFGDQNNNVSATVTDLNSGYHLVVVKKTETSLSIQIDDSEPSVSSNDFTMPEIGGGIQLGTRWEGATSDAACATGLIIDDFAIWERVLSSDEIAKLCTHYHLPVTIEVNQDTNYSSLNLSQVTSTTPLELVLQPGVTLTMDQAPELMSLHIISEGTEENPAIVKTTTNDSLNNIGGSYAISGGAIKVPLVWINNSKMTLLVSTLIADVTGNETLTRALTGNYAFWKDGDGILTLGANINVNEGVEVLAGTLKFSNRGVIPSTVGSYPSNDAGNVKVHEGATLDVNGKGDAFLNMVTLCKGATYKNSGSTLGGGTRQLKGITLLGDAIVHSDEDFGILAHGHNPTVLRLNGYTLTKRGSGKFWLTNTTVGDDANGTLTSGGVLKVEGGSFNGVASNWDEEKHPTFKNITFDSDQPNAFELGTGGVSGTVTKKGSGTMTIEGVISGSEALTVEGGSLILTGANANYAGAITINKGSSLKTTQGLAYEGGDNPIVVNGNWEIAGTTCYRWVKGNGTITVTGNSTIGYGSDATQGGIQEFTGNLIVKSDKTLTLANYNKTVYDLDNCDLSINGTLATQKGNNTSRGVGVIVASGKTLSGSGTISTPVTFESGSMLDTSVGSLTVSNGVTLPTDGVIYVKVADTVTLPNTEGSSPVEILTGTTTETCKAVLMKADGPACVATLSTLENGPTVVASYSSEGSFVTDHSVSLDANATEVNWNTYVADKYINLVAAGSLTIIFTANNQTFKFDNGLPMSFTSITVNAENGVDTSTCKIVSGDGAATVTAGSTNVDTSVDVSALNVSSLGAVTIAADKTLTVGALSSAASYAADSTSEVVITKDSTHGDKDSGDYDKYSSIKNLTIADCTLTSTYVSGGTGIASGRTITIDGQKAELFINTGDGTGYDNGTDSKIIAKNGGKLVYASRDTLKTAVELTGGTIQINDNAATGNAGQERALDFFNNNDSVADISVLAADGATEAEPTKSYITALGTGNNRKLSLRQGSVEFNVAANATLDVNGYFANVGGTASKFLKTGAGVMTLLGNDASTFTTSVDIDAGTIKLCGASTLGTGTINVDGTLIYNTTAQSTPTNKFTGTGTITADGCTLDLAKDADVADYTGKYSIVNEGTLVLPAGKEGNVVVPDGCTLKLVLSEEQQAGIYRTTATKTGTGAIVFVVADALDTPLGTEDGYTYVTTENPIWTPTSAASTWKTADCWNTKEIPTEGTLEGTLIVNAMDADFNATLVVPTGYAFTSIKVYGNDTHVTKVTFADAITATTTIDISGRVALPHAVITNTNVTLSVASDATVISIVDQDTEWNVNVAGNYNFGKMGSGTLTLTAQLSGSHPIHVLEGTLKFNGQANGYYSANITIDAGATLAIDNKGNYNPVCGSGTIVNNGTFSYSGTGHGHLPATVSGSGQIAVNDGTLTLVQENTHTGGTEIATGARVILGGPTVLPEGSLTGAGTVEINAAADLPAHVIVSENWTGTVELLNSITLDSKTLANLGNGKSLVKILGTITDNEVTVPANVVIGGNGTITGNATFANGATLDASAGALTVTGDVTWNGTAVIKLPADVANPVLKTAQTLPESYTLKQNGEDALTYMLVAKTVEGVAGIYAVEPTVPEVSVGEGDAVEVIEIAASNITAIKAAAAAKKIQTVASIVGAKIGDKTVDVAGLELFDNVAVKVEAQGTTGVGKATIDYAFGITSIGLNVHVTETKNGEGEVTSREIKYYPVVTAKVNTIAGAQAEANATPDAPAVLTNSTTVPTFAEGVTVELYCGTDLIGSKTAEAGEYEVEIIATTPIVGGLGTDPSLTKPLTIKAVKTQQQ